MAENDSRVGRRNVLRHLASAGVLGTTALAGCTGGGGGGSAGGNGSGSGGEFKQITALGGITGGSGYQQCLALQQILHKNHENIRVTVSGTSGWKTDAKLMWQKGDAEFGIVPSGDAYNILHGNQSYKKERNYIFQVYPAVPPSYLHVVAPKKANIKTYSDLKGKKLNVLTRGSLTSSVLPKLLKAIGAEPQKLFHYPHQQAASALQQGSIDAVAGAGVASPYQEMSHQMKVTVPNVQESSKKRMSEAIPWLSFDSIDFGKWYQGAKKSRVPAPWTVMACQQSLSDDFVYKLVKSVFNNIKLAAQIYEPATQLKPELAPKTQVPVHPGAYKFYEEQGISFPDSMKPPYNLPLKG